MVIVMPLKALKPWLASIVAKPPPLSSVMSNVPVSAVIRTAGPELLPPTLPVIEASVMPFVEEDLLFVLLFAAVPVVGAAEGDSGGVGWQASGAGQRGG